MGQKDNKDILLSNELNGWYIGKALSKNPLCVLNTDMQPNYKGQHVPKMENSKGKHWHLLWKMQHRITKNERMNIRLFCLQAGSRQCKWGFCCSTDVKVFVCAGVSGKGANTSPHQHCGLLTPSLKISLVVFLVGFFFFKYHLIKCGWRQLGLYVGAILHTVLHLDFRPDLFFRYIPCFLA